MNELTHIDGKGKANMVDVGNKTIQRRVAKARGHINIGEEAMKLVNQNRMAKGDVLTVAQIAAVQAAKKTSDLIPLCHNIGLDKVDVKVEPDDKGVYVECIAKSTGKTGVEMEALTGVSVALLTVYDMCKAVDKAMVIDNIELIEKTKNDVT